MSEWKQRVKPIHTNDPLAWIDKGRWRIAVWETRRDGKYTHKAKLSCYGKEIDHTLGDFFEVDGLDEIKKWALDFANTIMGEWNV